MAADSEPSDAPRHQDVKDLYDEAQQEGLYAEGMRRMALYHRHCQDPVIFQALGEVRGRSLLDLACGDGFYTRKLRRAGAGPVVGIDLSPEQVRKAQAIERDEPLGIEYLATDVLSLEVGRRFAVVTAIHLLHYLETGEEIATVLRTIHQALEPDGRFVTMIANPDFDLGEHEAEDSRAKFGYYFSLAEPDNGGLMRFHPGGFSKEREITVEFRRWHRHFLDGIAREAGFVAEWHDPFISGEGLDEHGADFFANYLRNPQSKLLRLTKAR